MSGIPDIPRRTRSTADAIPPLQQPSQQQSMMSSFTYEVTPAAANPADLSSSPASQRRPSFLSEAEKRANHNATERARRESLNYKFQELAQTVPALIEIKKPSKAQIVSKSLEYVKWVQRRCQFRDQLLSDLVNQNNALRDEVNHLRAMVGAPGITPTSISLDELVQGEPVLVEEDDVMSVSGRGAGQRPPRFLPPASPQPTPPPSIRRSSAADSWTFASQLPPSPGAGIITAAPTIFSPSIQQGLNMIVSPQHHQLATSCPPAMTGSWSAPSDTSQVGSPMFRQTGFQLPMDPGRPRTASNLSNLSYSGIVGGDGAWMGAVDEVEEDAFIEDADDDAMLTASVSPADLHSPQAWLDEQFNELVNLE